MRAYALTDKGRVRSLNQDYIFSTTERTGILDNLFILADGMGGHQAGDFASRFVVERMKTLFEEMDQHEEIETIFHRVIGQVNEELYEESIRNEELRGMGTTLVLATIQNGILYVANIGDSRLYLCRNEIIQITKDHSYVEELVALGKIQRGSRDYQEKKNIITRAVGVEPVVNADLYSLRLKEGDSLLLCSDGLSNMVEELEMEYIIHAEDSLKLQAEALVEAANRNGGKDNISVILIEPQISEVSV